jgi:hypothetical protein
VLCSAELANAHRRKKVAQAASTYLGEQRRRSTRVEQTSPVIIRGVDLLGQPFEERTAAQNLSFHGCRYASKHHLPKNTWVTLEVPSGESQGDAMCVRARVAWIQRPQTLRDLFQVGVELEKGRNVWGVTSPPSDWSSGSAAVTTMTLPIERALRIEEGTTLEPEEQTSLETYLQMALAHTSRDFTVVMEEPEADQAESNTLLAQLRREFVAESTKVVAEAREAANEAAEQKARKLLDELERIQEAGADAIHKQWLEELERGKADTRAEIASALAQDVAAQLASFQEQVRGALESEWAQKLSHAQVERAEWKAEVNALREEVRAGAEESARRSDAQLYEKLMEIRRELEASQGSTVAADGADPLIEKESLTSQMLAEADTARAQWNELLESSLDSAAQRLNERLTGGSQELLHRTEQELAKRLAELQKESGLTTETSRAALSELKAALETEVAQAKTALGEIEQVAGRFSEYSRQLEAASQDSLNELRQRLQSSVAEQCAELDRHAEELEGTFSKNAAQLLEQMGRETAARSAEEINAKIASGLDRATKAAEELAAREEQAEGTLRIHRERLRQVAEQVQRDGATRLESSLAVFEKDLEGASDRALAGWKADVEANGARAAEDASAEVAKEIGRQLVETDVQLLVQAQQALDSARERMHKEAHMAGGKFRSEIAEFESQQQEGARQKFASAAKEQIESAKNEFTQAAEKAAATFGEVIDAAAGSALQSFSAASDAKAEEGRAQLAAAAEHTLHDVQSHAQSSFEHFQEQLAIRTDQALDRASEILTHQFDQALERFRAQGEGKLEDWCAKQNSLSEQALEKHDARLQAATSSWVESTLGGLDAKCEERIDSTVRATENAVRKACADIFDGVAQTMKRQLQGALEIRPVAPAGEASPQEHRASA